jgi:hypothetical protein
VNELEEGDLDEGTTIRVRKSEVYFGDEKRIILQISDITDSINFGK